jgi:hypothetical protein
MVDISKLFYAVENSAFLVRKNGQDGKAFWGTIKKCINKSAELPKSRFVKPANIEIAILKAIEKKGEDWEIENIQFHFLAQLIRIPLKEKKITLQKLLQIALNAGQNRAVQYLISETEKRDRYLDSTIKITHFISETDLQKLSETVTRDDYEKILKAVNANKK